MVMLHRYHIPGLYVEEHAIDVPFDWAGKQPGDSFEGESLRLFYRVVTSPEHIHDERPLLVFFQGGPGGASPRPLNPTSDGWIAEAVKHFRVVLPDQRGTGRSSRVDSHALASWGSPDEQARRLKHYLADSIVRDFEHLRRVAFDGHPWVTLGQSYGGFLTLSYLSLFPEGVAASFTTGGIPHVPADATELYRHTFPRMARKTEQFYARYPQDVERVVAVADYLHTHEVDLPNGDRFTVERLQTLGSDFGMKPSFERLHWLLDTAFVDGDGAASRESPLSDAFLQGVMTATATQPLYWPLQEFIYANGVLDHPISWAAQQVYDTMPAFGVQTRPLLFTGEAIFPWMFREERALRPYADAVNVLMQDTDFAVIYDAARLERNTVPLQAAVYFDDMYVDSGLQLDTLSHLGNSHYWVTNEFEHDGLHGDLVFRHIYGEALDRGDLAQLF